MCEKLISKLLQYFIIKKPWKVLKHNGLIIIPILKSSKIRVNGEGNRLKIDTGNFKRLKIGIDGNNNSIVIDEGVYSRDFEIIVQGNNHSVYIGKKVEIGGANIVCCGENSKIHIGNNCLLASNINIKSCDGHSIYQNDKLINNSKEVVIGDNVWIAQDVNILKGVSIGNNSVVGISSLVTSNIFPSNVILGGVPAKIIKRNINWSKEGTL